MSGRTRHRFMGSLDTRSRWRHGPAWTATTAGGGCPCNSLPEPLPACWKMKPLRLYLSEYPACFVLRKFLALALFCFGSWVRTRRHMSQWVKGTRIQESGTGHPFSCFPAHYHSSSCLDNFVSL